MGVVAVALELQHAVDEVLEHPRPGDRAVLRHVADEERGDAVLLRDAQQAARRLAHLRDRAGRRADLLRPERLHRVDHADGRPLALERLADDVELGLREDLDPVAAAEAGGAQLHLRHRLLAGDEERPPLERDRAERVQQQRRLADARLAADEHDRRRHEPAAEHAVELRHTRSRCAPTPRRRRRRAAAARGTAQPACAPRTGTDSASIVPNSPQPGQRPSQRPDDVPHSVHTCWTAAGFAMGQLTVLRRSRRQRCRLWNDRSPGGPEADPALGLRGCRAASSGRRRKVIERCRAMRGELEDALARVPDDGGPTRRSSTPSGAARRSARSSGRSSWPSCRRTTTPSTPSRRRGRSRQRHAAGGRGHRARTRLRPALALAGAHDRAPGLRRARAARRATRRSTS